jgi:hypothetical protein
VISGDYFVGLDLGPPGEFTAVGVVERSGEVSAPPAYALRHLQRFPAGCAFTEVVPAVANLMGALPQAPLVVDFTAVGRPPVEALWTALPGRRVVPVVVTNGLATADASGEHHVPKRELVSCLQLLLQGRRLRVARSLPEATTLADELATFRVKAPAGASATDWRDRPHDDLILAVVLACWWAERTPRLATGATPIRFTPRPHRHWPEYSRERLRHRP